MADVRTGRSERVPAEQPLEILPLVSELNLLLEQNAANLERARRHVANLAHGLTTPLATLAMALSERGRDATGKLLSLVLDYRNDQQRRTTGATSAPPRRFQAFQRPTSAGLVIALLAVGAAGGAGAYRYVQKSHPQSVLLLKPAPIGQMTDASIVAVKGHVAEVFGHRFIIQDDSGRTLVDTGPRGEGGKLVAQGEAITIQGRFENGFIHANVMTRADGTCEAFGPPNNGHHDHEPGC